MSRNNIQLQVSYFLLENGFQLEIILFENMFVNMPFFSRWFPMFLGVCITWNLDIQSGVGWNQGVGSDMRRTGSKHSEKNPDSTEYVIDHNNSRNILDILI